MSDELRRRVEEIFEERLHIRPPDGEVDLLESGVIDSLTFIDLIAELEREFRVTLDEGNLDIDDFRSIERIAALVEREGAPPRTGA